VRYTVSNSAREIVLTELLKLNHQRHSEEVKAEVVDEDGKVIRKKESSGVKKAGKIVQEQKELF
jgi:hypothetical protein